MAAGTEKQNLSAWWIILSAVVLYGLAFTIRISLEREPIDDAYITFRQAERLWEGKGWAYNDGEKVIATTTPLWTLILAPLSPWLPGVARYLGVFLDSFVPGLILAVARCAGLEFLPAVFAALLYVFSPDAALCAPSGMELPLFHLLFVLAVLFQLIGWRFFQAASMGLLCLVRPEGILAAGLITLTEWRKPAAWLRVGCAVVPYAGWTAFTSLYYSSGLLPNSLQGKWDTYADGILWDPGRFLDLVDYWGSLFFKSLNRDTLYNAPRAVIFFGLVVYAAWLLFRRRNPVWVFPAYAILYTIAAQFVVVPLFSWYYCHPSAGIGIGVVAGSFFVSKGVSRISLQLSRLGAIGAVGLWIFLAYGGLVAIQSWPENKVAWVGRVLIDHEREKGHRICAQAILNDLRIHPIEGRHPKVLVHDLGLLGYELREAYMVDVSAIATPHVTPWHKKHPDKLGFFRVSKGLIEEEKPDYFVTMAEHGPVAEEDWAWVDQYYECIGYYIGTEWAVPFVAAYKKVRNDF